MRAECYESRLNVAFGGWYDAGRGDETPRSHRILPSLP